MHAVAARADFIRGGLTLAALATAKAIPADFLRGLGVKDSDWYGRAAVAIPYRSTAGEVTATRYRVGLDPEGDRFKWRRGAQLSPYGLDRMASIRERGYCWIVEGESDTWTLWLHDEPAVGIPGAAVWRDEWAASFAGIPTLYVVQEPGEAGRRFAVRLAASLGVNRVRVVRP